MKQFLVIAIAFLFVACDEDEAEVVYNIYEEVFVTQMTENDGSASVTHTYTYDGNKLLTDTDSEGYERQYTYVNDLLVQEDVYLAGELSAYTIFSYTAEKELAQAITVTSNGDGTWSGIKMRYLRNDDGTITLNQYQGDEDGQYDLIATGSLIITQGNITQYTLTDEDEDPDDDVEPLPVITTLTYTENKAPFKNIFGYEALCLAHLQGGPNTIASVSVAVTIQVEEGTEEEVTTVNYTYQYNANGYPDQELRDNGITRQFIYN